MKGCTRRLTKKLLLPVGRDRKILKIQIAVFVTVPSEKKGKKIFLHKYETDGFLFFVIY